MALVLQFFQYLNSIEQTHSTFNKMNFSFSEFKWRLFILLLAFQALAVIETERASVADAAPFKKFYKYRRGPYRPYGYYGGRPYNRPTVGPDEEYQYGPGEIPYIFYS